jgi:DNA-binding PadR family transcriptional regulator
MYGLEIIKESDGGVGRAEVYLHLQNLVGLGEVTSRDVDPEPGVQIPRKLYRLTEAGFTRLRLEPK